MLDPFAQVVREAHIARRDAFLERWWTPAHEARWLAERARWTGGDPMVCTSAELFRACMFAGLDREAGRFVHVTDRENSRRWLIPGSDGGRVVECDAAGMPL